MNKTIKIMLAATLVGGLTACAADDPNKRAKTGAAIGAVLGAVAGHQIDDGRGRYIGAAVGAIAGGAAGHYMDKQALELEQKLSAERARNELQITRLSGDALKIGVASDASFDVDSAQLRPEAMNTFTKIAAVLKDYDKTVIHVVGHTDSDGTDSHNQGLSDRRAGSVATYISGQGVPGNRVRQEGRGEREPVANNGSSEGKRKNRRVDIVIKPVIEGQEDQAWTPPPYLGA